MKLRPLLRRFSGIVAPFHIPKRSLSSTNNGILLHHEWIGPTITEQNCDSSQQHTVVFLHGLLGNGKNLRTFAKKVVGVRNTSSGSSTTRGLLLDLRGHGKSPSGTWPHTFEACVRDVHTTLQHVLNNDDGSTTTLVGHSWGGRVALQYAHEYHTMTDIQQTWLLDTVPGQAHSSVQQVLSAVLSLPRDELSDRKAVASKLASHGLDKSLAQWLAASIQDNSWGFDTQVVQQLLPEFGTQDFVGMLNELRQRTDVHLVRGGKNHGWKDGNVLETLESMASEDKGFRLHTLHDAGHWVHVDDLKGLVKLFEEHR